VVPCGHRPAGTQRRGGLWPTITDLLAWEIRPPPDGWKRWTAAGGRATLRHAMGGAVEVVFQLLPFEDGDTGWGSRYGRSGKASWTEQSLDGRTARSHRC